MADPKIGEDGLVFEDRPLSMSTLQAIPTEMGLWKTPAVYTCLEANENYIVIGSEQGYVWVVDLETSKLIREYSEYRGTAVITVVRLSPSRDLLAYGTSDGHVRVDKISRSMSNKLGLKEKVKQGVRALEWNGDELFCGFELGRVIRMKINIYDGTMSTLTFPESYGSGVTQLSCKGNSLLVSTVERTWMVDTETHKLEQVGRKDRKAGQYGGCLMGSGETAYVARPGLRLWAADNSGKVLRTVVYKEALSTQALPRVPLHSWSSLVPSYNRAWQFTAVLPWVGEHFIITSSEHTLFILDPKNGLIVGVLALGHAITDIAVTRSFVYLLCNDLKKPVCRISVKQSFLRALKRTLPSSPVPSPMLTRNKVTSAGPTLTVPTTSGKVEADNDEQMKSPNVEREEKETSNVESETKKVKNDSTVNVTLTENTILTEDDISSNTQSTVATPDQSLPTIHQPALVATDHPLPTTTTPADPNSSLSECMEDEDTENIEQATARDKLTTNIPVKLEGDTQTETETVTLSLEVPAMTDEPLSLLDAIDTPTHTTPTETPSDAQLRVPSEEDATIIDSMVKPSAAALDSDTKTEQVFDSSTNTKNESSSSMQREQKEPSLQEALKAEVKELFKPINFDKLSNIFKSNNPRSSSPNRLRVLASRNRKTENEESNKPQDLNVEIEEVKDTSEVANQKDDQESTKKPDLKEILKLSRIGNLLSKDTSASTGSPLTTPIIITPAPLDAEEQERRLRMSQSTADDQDDVVVVKKDKKKRRKRKYKKLSSATSSVSVSLEKLTEIEEEVEDSPTLSAIATPLSRPTLPSVPFTLTVEQTMKLELLKLERNDESKSVEREQSVLESLPEGPTEEEKNETEVISSVTVESVVEEIDESNPEQISLEQDETIKAEPELDITPHKEHTVDDVTTPKDGDDTIDTIDRPASPPLFEDTDSSPSDPLFPEDPLEVIPSPTPSGPDSRAGSREKSMTATLGDLSDNPLYHDSDHETRGRGNEEATYTKNYLSPNSSRTRNTAPGKFQSSLLQPVEFDPLRSDDSFEGLCGSRQLEDDKLIDSTPVNLRPRMLSTSPDTRRRTKGKRPSPVVSGSWDGYNASRDAREMSAEASDSSHEDDDDENLDDSQVASDFYQLCGSLIRHSNQSKEAKASASSPQKFSWTAAASEFQRQSVVESDEEESDEGPVTNADIWVPIPHPGRSQIQCVCLSESLLWIVDGRKNVFCTTTASKGKDWQHIKKPMSQICSSQSGNIIWGIHHWNAYVRLGIGLNPAGSYWKNATKGTVMSRKIKYLAVSETGVWGITTDNRTIYRRGVEERSPGGKMWLEVSGEVFSHISCCKNIVWAHTNHGKVFIREGITPSTPSGRKWNECKCPKMISSCLTSAGVAWGINHEGSIGFRCGISASKPSGKGPWWEVKINALTHPSSPYNSLWQVMGSEGSHLLTSVTNMLPQLMPHSKPLVLSASSKAGVIILQDSNRLHACWRTATGYHYRPASKSGLFPITTWSNMAVGITGLWLVRDDGDLHCLTAKDQLKRIECPAAITHVAASPACMWIVADNLVWSRQGFGEEVPEGVSFNYIEVSTQLHERKIQHIACGKTAVWALDKTGVPHFRFGVHSREPGTGMSPAWIPVEDFPHPLLQISVCPDNWLVWARDEKFNCYVRAGVTHDFPIGVKWEVVPGEQIRELCVTNEYVYGLTPTGELLCRYGISEENVQGNYWRRMPGRYEHLATGQNGELWTLDPKGQVWKQESKILTVSHDSKAGQNDFETSMTVDQSWEVV